MNQERPWTGQSRKLLGLLLAVSVLPAATLIGLGVQLLQQDRSLAAQRELERRTSAAQAIVRSLERSLAAAERWFDGQPLQSGLLRLTFSPEGISAFPADRLLWVTSPAPFPASDDGSFAEAEQLEFQGSPERASTLYERAARSPIRTVRAGALVRLARVRRQQQRWDAALAAYKELTTIGDVAVAGAPADLQARRALCAVLDESGRHADLTREALALEAEFLSGRWTLDHAAWTLTASELQRWTTHAVDAAEERKLFSIVTDTLADNWRATLSRTAVLKRSVVTAAGTPVTVISRGNDEQTITLAVSPSALLTWIRDAIAEAPSPDVRVNLLDPSGQVVAGEPAVDHSSSVKMPAADTNLPWTIVVSAPGGSLAAELAGRRRLLSAGLGAILLLLGGGVYFLWRVLQRELAVARLQTDFVAAVSHEFRTPLTSLRHVTELLEESDDLPPDRRRTFYQALGRSTERLHRLVETLLDFSRMEGGRKPYDFRPLDASELVAQVVADFAHEASTRGCAVNFQVTPGNRYIRADAEALTHALWNLLDNAVKYSPDRHAIDVAIHTRGSGVVISVCDTGLGIPVHERREIFQRFVRGAQASRLGIKGTGLGLAMVSHIVKAHSGAIELESEEGAGSTFTIVLPLAVAAPRDDADRPETVVGAEIHHTHSRSH